MFISRTTSVVKLFFSLSFIGLLLYITLFFYTFHTAYLSSFVGRNTQPREEIDYGGDTIETRFDKDLKYILIYTRKNLSFYKEGQYHFVEQRCPVLNCYLTTKKHLLNGDLRNFDAVVINVTELGHIRLPKLRRDRQKYIFYGMEASDRIPVCGDDADGYFNWTWSYKLYSDILSPFFVVKDMQKNVVAPRPEVAWSERMLDSSIGKDEILKLKGKTKAIATIVRSCREQYGRVYIKKMRKALKPYSLELDIFGCEKQCPNNMTEGCDAVIRSDYYFVLVQEKLISEDYLTDKILKAYLNNAVPIVRTGADLTKFLPPRSYLDADVNAYLNNAYKVAAMVHYLIKNPDMYLTYFKWKYFYTFHKSQDFEGVCELCALLNNDRWMNDHRTYGTLRKWWFTGQVDLHTMCFKNVTTAKPTEPKNWF